MNRIINKIIDFDKKWSDSEYCLRAVKATPGDFKYVKNQTPEICLSAVNEDGCLLAYVINQTPEICAAAIVVDDEAHEYVILPESEQERKNFLDDLKTILLSVEDDYSLETYNTVFGIINEIIVINNLWYDLDYCTIAIKNNPYKLQFVKKQTSEVCLTAVKRDGKLLQYVRSQTPEICAAAIKQNSEAYKYVRLPKDEDKRDRFLRELGLLLLAA